MAPDPYPPRMQSSRVHGGEDEVCRAIGMLTAGALGALFIIGWVITDQFNPACTGVGDPATGWHSGTECAQENYTTLPFFFAFAVAAIFFGLNWWIERISMRPDGIHHTGVFIRQHVPWTHITEIETVLVDTNSGGIKGVVEESLGLDKLWRVVAHSRTGIRHHRTTLIEMRDEQAARTFANELSAWLRTHYPRRG